MRHRMRVEDQSANDLLPRIGQLFTESLGAPANVAFTAWNNVRTGIIAPDHSITGAINRGRLLHYPRAVPREEHLVSGHPP